MTILAVVPARYASTRFPGKPLAEIDGKPMIWYVYQAAKLSVAHGVVVATDDKEIAAACDSLQIGCVVTSKSHATGSDRVAELAHTWPADIYVDIQGDEPLIEPATINAAIQALLDDTSLQVVNLCALVQDPAEILDANTIKVVRDSKGLGVYLSRQPIPYPQNRQEARYYKQVCVYAFRPDALRKFANTPQTRLEKAESVHILRFWDIGIPVKFKEVQTGTLSVDTPADLERVRAEFERRKVRS